MSQNQDAELFRKTLSSIAANNYKKANEKTNAFELIGSLWHDEEVQPELIDDRFQSIMEMLCQVVLQECELNVSKIGKKVKSFSQTLFKVWKAACNIYIKQKKESDGSIFLYPIECLLKENRAIWTGTEDGVWWDTLDIAETIFSTYGIIPFSEKRTSYLMDKLIGYVNIATIKDCRKELVKLCEVLSIFVDSLRYLPQSIEFEQFLTGFSDTFVTHFNWSQGMNPSRTSVLNMVTSLIRNFSFGYRPLLLTSFLPIFRQLFPIVQIFSIQEEALRNPGEHQTFNKSLILFLDAFLELAYPDANLETGTLYVDAFPSAYHLCQGVFNSALICLEREKTKSNYMTPFCGFSEDVLRLLSRLMVMDFRGRSIKHSNTEIASTWVNDKKSIVCKVVETYDHNLLKVICTARKLFGSNVSQELSALVCRNMMDFLRKDSKLDYSASVAIEVLTLYLAPEQYLEMNDLCFLDSNLAKWLDIPTLQDASSDLIVHLFQLGLSHFSFNFSTLLDSLCQLRWFSKRNIEAINTLISSLEFNEDGVRLFINDPLDNINTHWKFRKFLVQRLLCCFCIKTNPSSLLFKLFLYFPSQKDELSCKTNYVITEMVDFFVETANAQQLRMDMRTKIHLFKVLNELKELFQGTADMEVVSNFDEFHHSLGNEMINIASNNSIDILEVDDCWYYSPRNVKTFISGRVNMSSEVGWKIALSCIDQDSARSFFVANFLSKLDTSRLHMNVIEIALDASVSNKKFIFLAKYGKFLSKPKCKEYILELLDEMKTNHMDLQLRKIAIREIILLADCVGLELDVDCALVQLISLNLFQYIRPTLSNAMALIELISRLDVSLLTQHGQSLSIFMFHSIMKPMLGCDIGVVVDVFQKLKLKLRSVSLYSDVIINWLVALRCVFDAAKILSVKSEGVNGDLVKVLYGVRSLADVLLRKEEDHMVFVSLMGTLLHKLTDLLSSILHSPCEMTTEDLSQTMSLIVLDIGCVGRVLIGHLLIRDIILPNDFTVLIENWLVACAGFEVFDSKQCAAAVFRTIDTIYVHSDKYPMLWKRLSEFPIHLVSEYILLFSTPESSRLNFVEQIDNLKAGNADIKDEPFTTCYGFWSSISLLPSITFDFGFLSEHWRLFPHLRPILLSILSNSDQRNFTDYEDDMWGWAKHIQTQGFEIFTVKYLLYLQEELCPMLVSRELYSFLILSEKKNRKLAPQYINGAIGIRKFLLNIFTDGTFMFDLLSLLLYKPYFGIKAAMGVLYGDMENKKKVLYLTDALTEYAEHLLNGGLFDENDVFLCACLTKGINLAGPKFNRFLWSKVLHLLGLYHESLLILRYFIDNENGPRCLQVFEHTKKNLLSNFSSGYREVMNLYNDLLIKSGQDIAVHGLPLEDQIKPEIKALVAEANCDWTELVTAFNQCKDWKHSSLASYHLGNNEITLDLDEGYEFLMNLSVWSLDSAKNHTSVFPKRNLENVGAHAYATFKLMEDGKSLEINALHRWLKKKATKLSLPGKELYILSKEIRFLEREYNDETEIDKDLKMFSFKSLCRVIPFIALKWGKSAQIVQSESKFKFLKASLVQFANAYLNISSAHRGIEVMNFAYDVTVRTYPKYLNNVYLMKAKLFKAIGDDLNTRYFLEKILREHTVEKREGLTDSELANYCGIETEALIMLANMSPDVMEAEEHLNNARLASNFIGFIDSSYQLKLCKVYGIFCQNRFNGLDAHKKSTEFKVKDYIVKELQAQFERASSKDRLRLGKELRLEKLDIDRVNADWMKYLLTIAECYVKALKLGTTDQSVVPRLAALIVQNYETEELMNLVKNALGLIPSCVWLMVTNILSGYLFIDKPVSTLIFEIMVRVVSDYPYHSLNTVLYHFNRGDVGEQNGDTLSRLLNSCSDLVALKRIIRTMRTAVTFYESISMSEFGNRSDFNQENGNYVMNERRFQTEQQFRNLMNVPVPIIDQPIPEPRNFNLSSLITYAHISKVVIKASGVSSPKILNIRTSQGVEKKMVIKPEDLRQDDLAQVLFKVANILIREKAYKGGDVKPVRTYIVVPITDRAGLIEYVDNTVSLNRWLIDEQRGAHSRYNPGDMSVADAGVIFKNWGSPTKEQFLSLCKRINPAFRHFFYETFSLPHHFFQCIRFYTDSLALWSVLCFIVGLGDRHLNNILVDEMSGVLVHIDLGMIFDFSRRILQLPERVPFRLTRDLVDPILIDGLNGRFKQVAVHALERLRENADVIVGLASLLLLDPMSTFPVGNRDDGSKNMLAESAITRLKAKLDGTEANYTRASSEQQVRTLIKQATDPENLCRMYVGWMPFI